jgi:hypothetical protein
VERETNDRGACDVKGMGRFKRRRVAVLALLAAAGVSVAMFVGTAGAVGNFFELDGNATDDSGAGSAPADWLSISGAIDSAVVTDGTGDNDDTFTGGSSKDDLAISGWQCKGGPGEERHRPRLRGGLR